MDVATVYVKDDSDVPNSMKQLMHKGYIETLNETGVWICDREDCRGKRVFYPAHRILKIEYNTGW